MVWVKTQQEMGQVAIEWTDEDLVAMTMAGDRAAFDELVKRYSAQFHRVAWGLVKNDHEAEDIVQTAFYNMFRKLHTFKPGSNFRSWAYRVVHNTGLMRLRRKRYRQEIDLDRVNPRAFSDAEPIDFSTAPRWVVRADRQLELKELREQLHSAIGQLPPKYQSVFVRREFDEMSLKEIGDEMGLSVPAVKSRLHRARLFLRDALCAQPGFEAPMA